MLTIDEIRRMNLAALRDQFEGVKQLADVVGVSESQMSQWLNGSADSKTGRARGMRSDSARRIEKKTKKPDGWLDQQHAANSAAAGPPAIPARDFSDRKEVSDSEWSMLQEIRDINSIPRLAKRLDELRAELNEMREFAAQQQWQPPNPNRK